MRSREEIRSNKSATVTHAPSSFHSSSYLSKLEASFMRDFTCCGNILPNLHDLLRHYEEAHTQASPSATRNSAFNQYGQLGIQGSPNIPLRATPGPDQGPQQLGQQRLISGTGLQLDGPQRVDTSVLQMPTSISNNLSDSIDVVADVEMDKAISAMDMGNQKMDQTRQLFGQQQRPQLSMNISSITQSLRASQPTTPGFDGDVNHNNTTNTIMMPADKADKSHAVNEITTQKSLFNYGADAGHTEILASITDSGYASLPTHDYKGSVQNTEMKGNQQLRSRGPDTNHTNISDNEDQYMDDTSSIYTAGPNIPPSKKDAYISVLADDLLNKALTERPDEESLDRICEALPRHLKRFAIKVGSSDSALICRDVMVFVRRYKSEIANVMRDNYITETRVRSDFLRFDPISNWHLDIDILEDPNTAPNEKPDDVMDDNHYDDLDEADRAIDSLPELSAYRDFISKHPAYEWLLQSIQKELYMGMPGNIQTNIRETILGYLPRPQRVSRREAPERHILTFTADWDPGSFLQEQEYVESPERAVERAITITGSKIDAQAATTTQYLNQTWPSSGIHLLHVVKRVMCDTNNMPFSCSLPDKTQLIAWSQGSKFKLEVIGTAESIADIGEQLAWLGSALRSSPYETGVTVVGAFVSGMGTNSTSGITEGQPPTFFCNISFNLDVVDNTGEILNGQCWHQLFRNPVIVKGYHIPRRPMSDMGLEISLDTMANLAGTHYINNFHNKIFIKGFSAMLVPTRHSDNILLWHLLCKKNGDRVSYLDGKDIHADDINLHDLETSRHILGWSSNIRYLVGSADANYNIERSWLRGLHESCKLEGISISKGRLIKSNHEAAVGKRDLSPWIVRDPYRVKLDFLSKKYMVLWDVGCKRGWLVNGVNALLHLLRASLEINKNDDFSFKFLLKSEMLEEAGNPYTVSAAMEVLLNSANLDMELYEECEQDESGAKIKFRVRDRVNDLFEALEKTIDYHQRIAGARGENLKSAPRKDPEGWDFKDIATNEDPTYPRLAKLKTVGKGWVDFTRAIEAVFLFGRDFGNLIDPVAENSTCSHWKILPSNKYYLAASAKDLNTIMDRMGNPRATPPRLTNSLAWLPLKTASNIRCCHAETHCDRAHSIWPLHISQPFPQNTLLSLAVSGAVVFGHSASIGWIWNDFGDPRKGELPLLDEESDDDNSADSGIGLSLRSSIIPESQHAGQTINFLRHEHYKIAIICALPEELMAVRALFDDTHQDLPLHESDTNTYALGRLGIYSVVAACLPSGDYGTNAASKVASDIEKSFPAVKWYFVVGIGGGIPSEEHDIRLGDVVVSTGVIQHDMGKVTQKGSKIKSTGFPQRPARLLLTAISSVQSDPSLTHDALEEHINHIVSVRPEYQSPGDDRDKLFQVNSKHKHRQKTCENCKGPHVPKKSRPPGPHIHYGLIASGNQVIKDAVTRDRIGTEMKVLCFEMEGAGVMATGNCLVIRGICDYADSHKNDEWHKYAAATAAAYTKFFLLRIRNLDVKNREVVQIQKRSVSSLEEDEFYLGKRARYHQE
ncbi:hypothetical protein GGI43DRAFT_287411 [Trichoderma evansii]